MYSPSFLDLRPPRIPRLPLRFCVCATTRNPRRGCLDPCARPRPPTEPRARPPRFVSRSWHSTVRVDSTRPSPPTSRRTCARPLRPRLSDTKPASRLPRRVPCAYTWLQELATVVCSHLATYYLGPHSPPFARSFNALAHRPRPAAPLLRALPTTSVCGGSAAAARVSLVEPAPAAAAVRVLVHWPLLPTAFPHASREAHAARKSGGQNFGTARAGPSLSMTLATLARICTPCATVSSRVHRAAGCARVAFHRRLTSPFPARFLIAHDRAIPRSERSFSA
ncbi:hypothetical protein K438DRAFT_532088 [Mycena galopus ATCC 62051]|nr:hypothetical protein K438DRAFT_532088 [Mycena galopus ATCC 62051]